MRRSKNSLGKAPSRVKALPWAAFLRVVMVVGTRWSSLAPKDRARLIRLLRQSRGRVGNLSTKERLELRRLVGKLDLKRMARELRPMAWRGRGRRRGRKRKRR